MSFMRFVTAALLALATLGMLPLGSASAGPGVTAPVTDGLAMHFDAANYNPGSGVWADSSGNGRNATQATSTLRPGRVDGALNGYPVVRFADDRLSTAALVSPLAQGNTVFVVGRTSQLYPVTGAATDRFPAFIDGLTSTARHALYAYGSSWSLFAGVRGVTNLAADTDWNVFAAQYSTTASRLWVNGVPGKPVVDAGTHSLGGLTIGGLYYQRSLVGDIAEILVYDIPLDETARRSVEAYLQAKYGLPPDPSPYVRGAGTDGRDWVMEPLPDPTSSVRYTVDTVAGVKIPMRDGVLLDANLWLPQLNGAPPRGCLVIADGYGGSTYLYGLSARGFAVVHASMRGSGASEGESTLYNHYAEDGYDLVEWSADQPWCSGNVGMYGTSLVGISQWLAARELPPSLKAIAPDVACADCYDDLWYMGGTLPGPGREAREQYGPEYTNAIQHRDLDAWWRERVVLEDDLRAIAERGIAVMATGAWQDYITNGNIKAFETFTAHGGQGMLLLGAGAHNGHQSTVNGDYTYAQHLTLFFDKYLDGRTNQFGDRGKVLMFVDGPDDWRYEDAWPIPDRQLRRFYLVADDSGTIASAHDGSLRSTPSSAESSTSGFTYDPVTGPFLHTMRDAVTGYPVINQSPREALVASWTSEPFGEPTEVTGEISSTFWARSSAADVDFHLLVTDVAPDGTSTYVTSGYINAPRAADRSSPVPVSPGQEVQYTVAAQATSHVFAAGHRVRLSLAGGSEVAPGQSEPQGPGKNPVAATVTILHERAHQSWVEIPVIGAAVASYTIDASAGVGGTVNPAGLTPVPAGGEQTFTFTPDPGFVVADVTVDGASVGAVDSYTFNEVTGNHTLLVSFTTRFSDVGSDYPFFPEITWLADQGITTGWPDGSFRPQTPVNRDAMAAFLYRYAGSPAFAPPADPTFSDVPTGYQFFREVEWLASTGITTGWDEQDGRKTFRPQTPINRDATAAFLYRFSRL